MPNLLSNCTKLLKNWKKPSVKKWITSSYASKINISESFKSTSNSSESLGTEKDKNLGDNVETSEEYWNRAILEAVVPLQKYSYEEQLSYKNKRHKSVLRKLAEKTGFPEAEREDGMCCPLDPTIPSPIINHYRNRSEFNVGRGPEGGKSKVVGFRVVKNGERLCFAPHNVLSEKPSHVSLAQAYNQYIQESPLDIMLSFTGPGPGGKQDGYWRECWVKSNQSGHHMLAIKIHPRNLTRADLDREKNRLKLFFTSSQHAESLPNLTSLYFQESTSTRQYHNQAPYSLLHGQKHIYEALLGSKFRISPDSFFQCNTRAAEVLYTQLRECCGINSNTVLLDICCGVGSIGISMASHVKRVIGIEVLEQSIEDAVFNAEFNNARNVEFLCGRVEKILPNLLTRLRGEKDIVAVVNPARAGLAPKLVRMIRKELCYLNRLVYISCKPEGEAMKNFVELCDPFGTKKLGNPFRAIKAVSIDMFPHTLHSELMLLFER